MKRFCFSIVCTVIFVFLCAVTLCAGEWKKDNVGWWWQNDDGSYPAGKWQWLDGDGNGIAECYYFYDNGYMASEATIDGSYVNSQGQWEENGIVRTSNLPAAQEANGGSSGTAASQGGGISAVNRAAVAAYKAVLENGMWNSSKKPVERFAVLDINNDGILECVAESAFGWDSEEGWNEISGSLLYYADGGVRIYEYGDLETFGSVDNTKGWFTLDRVRGKAADTVMSFDPGSGVTLLDTWFGGYEYEEDQWKPGYYLSNMRECALIPADAANLAIYLGGDGRATF